MSFILQLPSECRKLAGKQKFFQNLVDKIQYKHFFRRIFSNKYFTLLKFTMM